MKYRNKKTGMVIDSDLVCAGVNWEKIGVEETPNDPPQEIKNEELDYYENFDEQDDKGEDTHINPPQLTPTDEEEGVLINPTVVLDANQESKSSKQQKNKKRD